MADLNDIQQTDTIKIVGSSSTGLEGVPINSSANGDMFVRDIVNIAMIQGTLVVSTTAVECRVGASNLANRKLIMIQPKAAGYTYGFSSGSQPFDIPNGSTLSLSLGPNISLWIKKASGSGNVAIVEFS